MEWFSWVLFLLVMAGLMVVMYRITVDEDELHEELVDRIYRDKDED